VKLEFCIKHGSMFMDYNADGEEYRRPLCLDCRWESGKGRVFPKIIKARGSKHKFVFVEHWGPMTAYVRRHLTNRLNHVVKGHFTTLEDVAYAIGGPKRPQEKVTSEYVPVQTNFVMAALRKFEERHGTVRTKQTREEKLEIKRQDDRDRRKVDITRMAALDADPRHGQRESQALKAADWASYHELGNAKKRVTSEPIEEVER
jgi:hypothetical protein